MKLSPCSCSRSSETHGSTVTADTSLEGKLANFDQHARDAVYDLIDMLFADRDRIVKLARERHIWGHHEYGDANLREWSNEQLRVERDQEVADWLVYRCDEIRRGMKDTF